jgi:hypothetical protein
MTTRRVVAAVVLFSLAAFAYLTLRDAVANGVSFLTIVSLVVLIVLGIGIVGALAQQPPEE